MTPGKAHIPDPSDSAPSTGSDPFIVTIDGQAGTGKTSVGFMVAQGLDAAFLDTGAMYRAVTLAAVTGGIDPTDEDAVIELAKSMDLWVEFHDGRPTLTAHGRPIDGASLRTPQVDRCVSDIARLGRVRALLVDQQRNIARACNRLVSEGRDQGSIVFPHAICKFFLTASLDARADRRLKQVQPILEITRDEIRCNLADRDEKDSQRRHGPLMAAADAITIDTTDFTQDQVVQTMIDTVRKALALHRVHLPGQAAGSIASTSA
jgi:cytidylate kinase